MCSFTVILHLCLCCTIVVVFFVCAHTPFWSCDVRWCGTLLYCILQMFVPFCVCVFYIVMWAFFWCLVESNWIPLNSMNPKQVYTLDIEQFRKYITYIMVLRFPNCKKKVIRIISGAEPRVSCRVLFRKLEILPVPCHYILSLMLFIIDNPNNFQTGLERHGLHARSKN